MYLNGTMCHIENKKMGFLMFSGSSGSVRDSGNGSVRDSGNGSVRSDSVRNVRDSVRNVRSGIWLLMHGGL
jgi:hypothetical protein